MQNSVAPILNNMAGRVVAGFVDAVSDHLFATCALFAAIAVALGLFWLDPVNRRDGRWMDGD